MGLELGGFSVLVLGFGMEGVASFALGLITTR